MSPFIFLAISIISTVTGQLLLKKGVLLVGKIEFSLNGIFNLALQFFKNAYLFFGLCLFVFAFIFWVFALSKKDLGIIYPISSSLVLSLIVFGSFLFFKESISLWQISGIVFIIFGIFLLLFKG
ncbi:MAG: hypothetical protein A2581_03200 [Candidatus Staskawiczbacteria bacterium RIFOXYD1_FULL_37_110]|nr:MAG: hypothetical protein A2444_01130 [Candidatus Staskawiczbacteria bacterium RIFOXYC2_FULL_37_19]OGZ88790.1 MAG: hypothetical protein A2581_03200 [Candidatus Staskawiczbacteria bacterium RIFOXYD1_FULL_37_110]